MTVRLPAVALLAALLTAPLACPLPAQEPSPRVRAGIDSLLTTSRIKDVLASLGPAVAAQLQDMAPDLTAEQRERVGTQVARHFHPDSLYASVLATMVSEAEEGRVVEVLRWLASGPVAEARAIADAYEPTLTLEAFVEGLREHPPPEERVRLLAKLAHAQSSGHFYLVLGETTRGAAHTLAKALRPDLPVFRSIPPEQAEQALEAYHGQAVVSFLHRFESVPDHLLSIVAERYQSEGGRWYVESYVRAVGDAVLTAAERASAELAGGR